MQWKTILVAILTLIGVVTALWLGFLGLSTIESREVQTAAIAAVSSLAGAIVAATSSYWLDRSRQKDREKERIEDELLRRLVRYQQLQWDAADELESTIFKLVHLAMSISQTTPDDKSAATKQAKLDFLTSQDRMMQLGIRLVDDQPLFESLQILRQALVALAVPGKSSAEQETLRETMSQRQSISLTLVHDLRKSFTHPATSIHEVQRNPQTA